MEEILKFILTEEDLEKSIKESLVAPTNSIAHCCFISQALLRNKQEITNLIVDCVGYIFFDYEKEIYGFYPSIEDEKTITAIIDKFDTYIDERKKQKKSFKISLQDLKEYINTELKFIKMLE